MDYVRSTGVYYVLLYVHVQFVLRAGLSHDHTGSCAMSVIVALVVSHTGLVSLPVPVVGQQNSTLLHVPVVPLVLASRARVVVGTGFPLLFHFTYH